MNIEQIWHKFNKNLLKYIRSRVRTNEDAQDIHAEVFLKILKNEENISKINNVHAWIYRVAKNRIIDYYRSSKGGEVMPPDLADTSQDLLKELSEKQLKNCLRQIITKLPSGYKEAVIATQISEMTHKEYANLTGESLPKVKSLVQRGRRKLRAIADDCLSNKSTSASCCMEF